MVVVPPTGTMEALHCQHMELSHIFYFGSHAYVKKQQHNIYILFVLELYVLSTCHTLNKMHYPRAYFLLFKKTKQRPAVL